MHVLADASLPNISKHLNNFFDLTLFTNKSNLLAKIDNADILICRSTLKVNEELLKSSKIKCVATASSGTDHIDKEYLKSSNITLLDAHGTNAQAVCDYVLASLAWLKRYRYVAAKKVGIVGVGAVGSKLWQMLELYGFEVIGYDPLRAQKDSNFKSCNIEDLYSLDIICVHANLHTTFPYPSFNLFNSSLLKKLKSGVIIINAARGGIVNEEDLLAVNNDIIYCTDVFLEEPNMNHDIVNYATLCTPHIAGHSIEAKDNAVKIIVENLYNLYAANSNVSFCNLTGFIDPVIKSLESGISIENMKLQDKILSKYNPYPETEALKLAKNKQEAFIDLRKSHTFRHDFF